MSRVAKYRRQVSEDPDIDNLLSTLSPEEMEELEKELDASDTDGSLPVGLGQKDQTDKQMSGKYSREKEPKRSLQREKAADSNVEPALRTLIESKPVHYSSHRSHPYQFRNI
uniref:Leiomodin-1 n=1 Tax=Sphaerodactylus townsendi TaxID=933632 RepID=A0ACB8F5E8_9SAUR